jgi:hypothetical protein
MRLLVAALLLSALGACTPPGEILLVIDRNDGDDPQVFDQEGRPAAEPFEGDGDGDPEPDVSGDGDGDLEPEPPTPEPEPPPPPPPPPEPVDCTYQWMEQPTAFVDTRDWGDCPGMHLVRYDPFQNLWVAIMGCPNGRWRIYLGEDQWGDFFPAVDWAGGGQDHCELVNPTFWLDDEDDINSGNCVDCSTANMQPIVGIPAYARGWYGALFEYVDESEPAFFAADLYCGNDPTLCMFDFDG